MASRILGMGDVLSLIEKAEQNFDMKKAAELEEKLRKSRFTLTDYLEQMNQLKKHGLFGIPYRHDARYLSRTAEGREFR